LSTVRLFLWHVITSLPDIIILALIKSLEAHGWDADTQVEHPSLTMGLPLEDLNVTPEERDENVAEQLKQSADSKRALIVKVSHVGGHKYAGNCIVSTLSSGIDVPLFHRVILRPRRYQIFRTLIFPFPIPCLTDLHPVWVRDLVRPSHSSRCGFDRYQYYH
jgi:hypothetical protein